MANETIGIKLADGSFYPILTEGIPSKKQLDLTTVRDNQTTVQVNLYRSPTSSMDDAVYVDTLMVENMLPHEKEEPVISLSIGIDDHDTLSAEVCDAESGNHSETTVKLVSLTEAELSTESDFTVSDTEVRMPEDSIVDDASFEDVSFDMPTIDEPEEGESTEADPTTIDEMSFDEPVEDELTEVEPATIDEMSFDEPVEDELTEAEPATIDEMSFDEPVEDEPTEAVPATIDEISFDEPVEDEPTEAESTTIDEMSFDEPVEDELAEAESTTIDEISFDEPVEDQLTEAEPATIDESEDIEIPVDSVNDEIEESEYAKSLPSDDDVNNSDTVIQEDEFPSFDDIQVDEQISDNNYVADNGSKVSSDIETTTEPLFDFDEDFESDIPNPSITFTDLYDKERITQDEEEEESVKKTTVPMTICILCAAICIIVLLILLFFSPIKVFLTSKKDKAPVEQVVTERQLPPPPVEKQVPPPVAEKPLPPPPQEAAPDKVVKVDTPVVVPVPPKPKAKPNVITHRIKWGDTLWDLAGFYYKNPWLYRKISKANGIKNPDLIISGTDIIIPAK